MQCERKYFSAYNLERRPESFSWPLEFGSAVHTVMGAYDTALGKEGTQGAVRAGIRSAVGLVTTWDEWRETTKYNSWNLCRIPVWYAEKFPEDALERIGPEWIEYHWELEYRGVKLHGYLDNLVRVYGETLVMDRKSTTRDIDGDFIRNFSPDVQFSLYIFAMRKLFPKLEIGGVLCEGFQLQVGSVDFERFIVRRSDDEMEEFEDTLNYWIDRRLALEGKEERAFLKNESSCYGCHWRQSCSASRAERERLRGLIK